MHTQLVGPVSGTRGRAEALTDLYVGQGKIGRLDLSKACYAWHETLRLVAAELWKRGEAEHARVMLKAGRQTVREFLRE